MKRLSFLTIGLFSILSLNAQEEVIDWSFEVEKLDTLEYKLVLIADIQPGWYIYSQYLESEDGPIATTLHFDEADNTFSLEGKAEEDGDKITGYDNIFMMNISKFKKEVKFIQHIKLKENTQQISGRVEFMTCNDDQCLPPKEVEFSFDIDDAKE